MIFIRKLVLGLLLAAGAFWAAFGSGTAWAEGRVALVVGNGSYGKGIGSLSNPPNDARLMADTLRQVGFDVIERVDIDQKGFKRAIKEFGDRLAGAGKDAVGFFFYAGHGIQVGGNNYMIPVGVEISDEADVDIEAVQTNAVQSTMEYAGNRMNIIVMDACRNNPFKRGFRSVSRGLAEMDATKGTLIAYATAPGDVAADGSAANSPYTTALSQTLLTPGLVIERVFKEVRNKVTKATGDKQVPWESSSLTGDDFYFRGGPKTAVVAGPAPDLVAWQSVQESPDKGELDAFVKAFPKSPFAGMARAKLQRMAALATGGGKAKPAAGVSGGDVGDVGDVGFGTMGAPFVVPLARDGRAPFGGKPLVKVCGPPDGHSLWKPVEKYFRDQRRDFKAMPMGAAQRQKLLDASKCDAIAVGPKAAVTVLGDGWQAKYKFVDASLDLARVGSAGAQVASATPGGNLGATGKRSFVPLVVLADKPAERPFGDAKPLKVCGPPFDLPIWDAVKEYFDRTGRAYKGEEMNPKVRMRKLQAGDCDAMVMARPRIGQMFGENWRDKVKFVTE